MKQNNTNIENILSNITLGGNTNMEYQTPSKQNNNKTKVAVYDINGYLIRTYNKSVDTLKDGFNPNKVSKCITGILKTHNNCIFLKVDSNSPAQKIDPKPFTMRKNSTAFKNQMMLNCIIDSYEKNHKQIVKIPENNKIRIGMFNKKGHLIKVFLHTKEIQDDNTVSDYTIYKYVYGDLTPKRLKKGYKGKYYFRRLQAGNSYTIGEKYNVFQIPYDTQTRFVGKSKKKITKEVPSSKEPKKGIISRIIEFFNL